MAEVVKALEARLRRGGGRIKRRLVMWARRRKLARHGVEESWRAGIASEVRFWNRYLETEGGEWPDEYRERLDGERVLQPYVRQYVPLNGPVRILDVGAGPMTILGRVVPGRAVELVATDALASDYNQQLFAAGLVPPVETMCCETERLTDLLAADSFDIVHARNTIDHHRDPVRAIDEMVTVTKPGGVVLLVHAVDEGENERYEGLHSWNITVRDDEVTLWNPMTHVSVDRHLEPRAARICADLDAAGILTVAYRKGSPLRDTRSTSEQR